ncbi:MAG: hypothetical protein US96_C0030G0006 [Candidatus Woesebacteria bacterium GW2011_GWB1_38_5b]|uniref:Toxin-antitoxin system, toxin component n=1 Tax=Candidatus Woesebacteria bacterium GW2011_GWB1_38_5b TaxID=1618569 RepID=A0A0G0NBP5_9BACT|nr:MAG: hypothetical protein US96_C0030G0006 [Candidatus Woesebacteria bacterium GW2011_GWB1_38_5b]
MDYKFDYSLEKNAVLKQTRGIGFEDIIQAIESGKLLDNKDNPNQKKYPGQKLFVVKIKTYAYGVPYVIDHERQIFFLKTFYPSRKLTKEYIKKL